MTDRSTDPGVTIVVVVTELSWISLSRPASLSPDQVLSEAIEPIEGTRSKCILREDTRPHPRPPAVLICAPTVAAITSILMKTLSPSDNGQSLQATHMPACSQLRG